MRKLGSVFAFAQQQPGTVSNCAVLGRSVCWCFVVGSYVAAAVDGMLQRLGSIARSHFAQLLRFRMRFAGPRCSFLRGVCVSGWDITPGYVYLVLLGWSSGWHTHYAGDSRWLVSSLLAVFPPGGSRCLLLCAGGGPFNRQQGMSGRFGRGFGLLKPSSSVLKASWGAVVCRVQCMLAGFGHSCHQVGLKGCQPVWHVHTVCDHFLSSYVGFWPAAVSQPGVDSMWPA
jgi:hypothetical protein